MKNALILILIGSFIGRVYGQQEPISSMFWNNVVHTNPGAIGLNYRRAASVLWRNQWTAINGAPTCLWGNYAERSEKLHGTAGMSYEYDVIGYSKSHTLLANYAYQLVKGNYTYSFGISAGLKTNFLHPVWIAPQPTIDPSIPTSSVGSNFQADLGVVVHTDKWNIGASVTQLNGGKIRYSDGSYFQNVPHLWLMGDYEWKLTDQLRVKPQFQVFTDFKKIGFTGNVLGTFKSNYWLGLNLTNQTNFFLGASAGIDWKSRYRIGYGLHATISKIGNVNYGLTHEIVLAYLIK
jgi:type IX secretion system PorP/SprF family membrane protein